MGFKLVYNNNPKIANQLIRRSDPICILTRPQFKFVHIIPEKVLIFKLVHSFSKIYFLIKKKDIRRFKIDTK